MIGYRSSASLMNRFTAIIIVDDMIMECNYRFKVQVAVRGGSDVRSSGGQLWGRSYSGTWRSEVRTLELIITSLRRPRAGLGRYFLPAH